jgi:choline kinase
MRVILLAAGQGFQVDGMNKCLIRDPYDGRRIIDKVIRAFPNYSITVVVGYQAVNVMQEYPQLNYIYNQDWGMTNNSYSLGLVLTDEPCYVLSCDLLFEPELIQMIERGPENIILTQRRENRTLTAVNCILDKENQVIETYLGALRDPNNPEAVGIFKISNPKTLRAWKQNCLQYRNLFVGLNLPLGTSDPAVYALDKGNHRFFEINTPMDYMRLLEITKRNVMV